MGDMKDKFKGFMKKVNNQLSSSSSGHFKGQGRVLGSSSSSTSASSGATNSVTPQRPPPPASSVSSSNPKPSSEKPSNLDTRVEEKPSIGVKSDSHRKKSGGFNSFEPLITSSKRNAKGYSLNVFECPVCGRGYTTEKEVSEHVESCLDPSETNNIVIPDLGENRSELDDCVGTYISGNPSDGSVEIILRLLRNVVKEPDSAKFRRVRLGNAKIREAIGEVTGGLELLECVGFVLREEDGEMWAVMEVPSEEGIRCIKKTISSLEQTMVTESVTSMPLNVDEPKEPKKVDREVRVFFSVPESVAANIELPDSFYNLSIDEVKREADARKKKLAESQLLIPKSYKEKQAKASKKKYAKTVIRVQFPDGVVLQGVFSPREPTRSLYEFVSTALKDPSLKFDLLHPVAIRRRAIPHFPAPGERAITLEEEELVPAALVKFKPLETDSVVFTGLCNELLEISEPLVLGSAVAS